MIRELKTLVAVAREGTFAAAGQKVGLTQAAVSAQMQRLEAELGFALFDRSGRTARLNDRGEQTLAQARDLLALHGRLGTRPVGAGAAAEPVRVGAIASVQRSLLPDALAAFHAGSPESRSRVVPGLSIDLVDQVDAGDLDLAVIVRPPFSLHADLRWRTLAEEPYRLLVPRRTRGDDALALLAERPFVRYDRASFGGRQVDRFLRAAQADVREVCEVDELDAIVRLVARGVGVALVPETAGSRAWPAAVRAIDLGARTFHREIGLVHRPARALSEPAARLARAIGDAYAAAGAASATAARSPRSG